MTKKRDKHSGIFMRVCALSVILIVLVADDSVAHKDKGAKLINDWVYLTEVNARTDQDDGGGESEYCIRIKKSHSGHGLMDGETIVCGDVNWDATNPDTGTPWNQSTPMSLPLVSNSGGHLASQIRLGFHTGECTPTNLWQYTVKLYEVDHTPAGEILGDLADVIREHGADALELADIATGGQAGKIVKLAGASADFLGRTIDKIFNGESPLGQHDGHFEPGAGDDETESEDSATLAHYSIKLTQNAKVTGTCGLLAFYFAMDEMNIVMTPLGACVVGAAAPLCLNYNGRTQQQYEQLIGVAAKIATIEPEANSTATADTARVARTALIELTGGIAELTADHQIAVAQTSNVPTGMMLEAADLMERGNGAMNVAIMESSTNLLQSAIKHYQSVHEMLGPVNYGDEYQAQWRESVYRGFDLNTQLAKAKLGDNQTAAAHAILAEMLNYYHHLPKAFALELSDSYQAEHGANLAELATIAVVEEALTIYETQLGP